MTPPIRRREGDPDRSAAWQQRDDPMELRLGMNGKSIQARGLTVIVVLVMLGAISTVWALDRVQTALFSEQHRSMKISQDRTSCIVAMTPSERERFRDHYQPGAFRQMCPWVDE